MVTDIPSGKALVLQSGGPTRVINRSLYGVVDELRFYKTQCDRFGATPLIDGMYGGLHGVRSILDENFIDLDEENSNHLYTVGQTPSSALRTTRYELVERDDDSGEIKVKKDDINKIFRVLQAHDIRRIFLIGGGDSSETAQLIMQEADDWGYDLGVIHVPKTIDNDLPLTDHCPGYGSAATFAIQALIGEYCDARANGDTIDLDVLMGRNTGWLTASGAYCRKRGWNPLIITPENPMEIEEFVDKVDKAYKQNGKVLQVIVSEGARNKKDEWAHQLARDAKFEAGKDTTGRTVLTGIPLANYLSQRIKTVTGARMAPDTFGYMQSSFLGAFSHVDGDEAEMAGREAVRFALEGKYGKMVSIVRGSGPDYSVTYEPVNLSDVAIPGKKIIRPIPPEYFNKAGQPNDYFVQWLEPLLGDIDDTAFIEGKPVKRLVLD